MVMTLNLNEKKLSYTQNELIQLGLNVAKSNQQYDYHYIYCWIKEHLVKDEITL